MRICPDGWDGGSQVVQPGLPVRKGDSDLDLQFGGAVFGAGAVDQSGVFCLDGIAAHMAAALSASLTEQFTIVPAGKGGGGQQKSIIPEQSGPMEHTDTNAEKEQDTGTIGKELGQPGDKRAVAAIQLLADLFGVAHGLHGLDGGLLRRDTLFLQCGGVVLQVGGEFFPGQTLGGWPADGFAHLIAENDKGVGWHGITSFCDMDAGFGPAFWCGRLVE